MRYPLCSALIDLSNTVSVTSRHAGFSYRCLHDHEQYQIKRELRQSYQDGSDVLDRVKGWKYANDTMDAFKHEATVKAALGDSTSNRGSITWQPSQSEQDAFLEVHGLSKALCRRRFGSSFFAYRGLNYESPFVLTEILENGTNAGYDPEPTVLSNYTTSWQEATGFSPLIAEKRVTPSDVALAANYIFLYMDPGKQASNPSGVFSPNGELRIRDAQTRPFRSSDLYVTTGSSNQPASITVQPLHNFMSKYPDQFNTDEHDVMYEFVTAIADQSGTSITSHRSKQELQTWTNHCAKATSRSTSTLNLQESGFITDRTQLKELAHLCPFVP